MPPDRDQAARRDRFWLRKWTVAAAFFACALIIGIILYISRNLDRDTFLNYFALGLLIFVFVTLFYGVIAIHDVPYEIAKHRNHPHQDAIHAAGWVSLFTLHALWPFLWIWAMAYRPERGWGFRESVAVKREVADSSSAIKRLERRISELEKRLDNGSQ